MKRTLGFLLAAVTATTTLAVVGFADPAAASPPADGIYMLLNDKSSRCLDQDYSDNREHQDVLAWGCNVGALNQRWRKLTVTGDLFYLINERSHKCLNQDYSQGREHSNVIAYTCDNGTGDNQFWYPYYDTGKRKWAIGNALSNKCLDQDYSNGQMHTNIIAYKCQPNSQLETTISNQLWWFESI